MAKQLLTREVAQLEVRDGGDGRTVFGRLVPYNSETEIIDPQTFDRYIEVFRRGAFEGALKHPERIDLRYSHDPGFGNVLGQGSRLEERDDGLYGEFRLYESVATRAREVIKGHAKHLSVGFFPIKSRRRNGIVERVKAYLEHIAATATPAYVGAEVLAVRDGVKVEEELPPESPSLDAVQEWLKQAGEHRSIPAPPGPGENLDQVQEYLKNRKKWSFGLEYREDRGDFTVDWSTKPKV